METKQLKKGFTLIELLVVIAIMGLVAGMIVIDYHQQGYQLNIDSDAEKIVSLLRAIQADALSGTLVDSSRPDYYGLSFERESYRSFIDNNKNNNCQYDQDEDTLVQSFSLTDGVIITNDPLPPTIIFEAPKADIKIEDKISGGCTTDFDFVVITLFQEASGRSINIKIYKQGKIEIEK